MKKIILGVIILLLVSVFLIYGSISPCEVLKKEIANEARKQNGQEMYVLFGGFIERGIDTLKITQCLGGLYKIKTVGIEETLDALLK